MVEIIIINQYIGIIWGIIEYLFINNFKMTF